MNSNQIEIVRASIVALKELEIDNIISDYILKSKLNPEEAAYLDIMIKDIPSYLKRLIKQFEDEIENSDFIFYPEQSNYGNEYKTGNLTTDLESMFQNFKFGNIEQGILFLKRLIWYQIFNGFWDKSKKKIHDINAIEFDKVKDESKLIQNLLNKKQEELQKRFIELDKKKEELDNFQRDKINQLQIINSNVPIAQNSIQQINDLFNQATKITEQINSKLEQSKQKLIDFDQQKSERLKNSDEFLKNLKEENAKFINIFDTFKVEIETIKNSINENFEHVKKLVDDVNSKKSFFDDRLSYLNELIGREVGVSLFETFKQRKKELEKPVEFWKRSVVIISLLTIGYIFFLFWISNVIEAKTATEIWQKIALNSIKTIPALFLLYYTISQYNKERNFQETYAFKSAVALTIKEYRNQLNDPNKQDELIIEAVKNVYRAPIINHTKSDNKDVNNIMDMLRSILDTVVNKKL